MDMEKDPIPEWTLEDIQILVGLRFTYDGRSDWYGIGPHVFGVALVIGNSDGQRHIFGPASLLVGEVAVADPRPVGPALDLRRKSARQDLDEINTMFRRWRVLHETRQPGGLGPAGIPFGA